MERIHESKEDGFIECKPIASIVTPLGEGGIGKVIVSGPDALSVVNKVFQGKGIDDLRKAMSYKLYYGYIFDGGQRIDEVIVNIAKKGDSFTGEDVVEVNCHGGIRVLMRIHECLQFAGAKGAAWDALLLQSYENNKMDFIRKEALLEVVRARTRFGVKVLLDQNAGALSEALKKGLEIIEKIRQALHKGSSRHETIPYTEQHKGEGKSPLIPPCKNGISNIPPLKKGCEGGFSDENSVLISALLEHIESLLETASMGMALTTPQVLVILGKPNVGKSTIINAVLGEERMLVHHEPGTTRDYVSEFISVEGIPFELVDTAGMRDTSDKLEAMSIELTLEQLHRSDKVIAVFDNSRPFDQEDEGILDTLNPWLKTENFNDLHRRGDMNAIIPVVNKCDLPAKLDRLRIESALRQSVCCISAVNKDGFEELHRRLVKEFDTVYKPMRPVVFNRRQYLLMTKADILIKQETECLIARGSTSKALQVINELKDIFTSCLKGT
ncbi:MAG: 50S ribosome-binding GTPase [Candidatus Brocadia sinica]|nr:50S ribosome-binding GTPase [Candidatus Brocadia sinica]